jgi:hypothetical protein
MSTRIGKPSDEFLASLRRGTETSEPRAEAPWGIDNVKRILRGRVAQVLGPDGNMHSLDLAHTPLPSSQGGTEMQVMTPWEHAAIDPQRFLGK